MGEPSDRSVLKREIRNAILRPFEVAGWSWSRMGAVYKAGEGISAVVNVEPSTYGYCSQDYVGYWFPEDPKEQIVYSKCSIGFPIYRLFPEQLGLIQTALDYEDTSAELLQELSEFIESTAVPEITRLNCKEAMREFLTRDEAAGVRLLLTARKALGIPLPRN